MEAPDAQTWALEYLLSTDLSYKCAPPPPPLDPGEELELDAGEAFDPEDLLITVQAPFPGRPAELEVSRQHPKSVKKGAMIRPEVRARLIHKFWHHELQAAELMCWAYLSYERAPIEFRRGLLRIARDGIRHMGLYQEQLERLGYKLGDFSVRDWFWDRVPSCQSAINFVSFVGMGLEAANLDHTERFGGWFREAGDEQGAAVQEQIGREEIAHVRFATRWFARWTGSVDFGEWERSLPPPLSPLLLRGSQLQMQAREKAEMPPEFLAELAAWRPAPLKKKNPPS